jgi:GT2 family glycosyltransferase
MKKIVIITVNYKSTPFINALEAKIDPGQAEYIVVDNSGDFMPAKATTRVVDAGGNIGFGRACNLGVERSDADIVLLANPDLELDAAGLSAFLDFSRVQSDDAIWGPFIRDGKGDVVSLFRHGRVGLAFRRRALTKAELGRKIIETVYVSGACMATSRKLFQELDGFSDKIFLYGEDLDLCLRAHDTGAKIYLTSSVELTHHGGGSSTRLDRFKRLFRSTQGHYAFFRLHDFGRIAAVINALHLASGRRF